MHKHAFSRPLKGSFILSKDDNIIHVPLVQVILLSSKARSKGFK
jgi:hypothetical protein